MLDKIEILGLIAGALTSLGFFPQVLKIWRTKSTQDISIGMYTALCLGFSLWITYGVFHHAFSIIMANTVSLTLSSLIIALKIKLEAKTK